MKGLINTMAKASANGMMEIAVMKKKVDKIKKTALRKAWARALWAREKIFRDERALTHEERLQQKVGSRNLRNRDPLSGKFGKHIQKLGLPEKRQSSIIRHENFCPTKYRA